MLVLNLEFKYTKNNNIFYASLVICIDIQFNFVSRLLGHSRSAYFYD